MNKGALKTNLSGFIKKKLFWVCLCLFSCNPWCQAQIRNFWPIAPADALLFDSVPVKSIPFITYPIASTAICDSLGKLVFYIRFDTIFNGNHLPLYNGTSIKTPNWISHSICLNYAQKKYAIIGNRRDSINSNNCPVYVYYLDMAYNNGQGRVEAIDTPVSGKHQIHDLIYNPTLQKFLVVLQNANFADSLQYLYLGSMGFNSPLTLTDSLLIDNPMPYRSWPIFNHAANGFTDFNVDSTQIITYSIDLNTLTFKPVKKSRKFGKHLFPFTYSPSDSFILGVYIPSTTFKVSIYQYNVFTDSITYLDSNYLFRRKIDNLNPLWLLPDHNIYAVVTDYYLNCMILRILNPDKQLDSLNIEIGTIPINKRAYPYFNMLDHITIQRVGFTYETTCRGINLYNHCDTGLFTQFIWYVGNDSFLQNTPHTNRWNNSPVQIHYSQLPRKSGKIILTIKALKSNGFATYSRDSVYYLAHPVARFIPSSSQGCQYVAYTFNDSSYADTSTATGYYWHYYFGDGTDTLISAKKMLSGLKVKHTYTSSGIFNVRLVFNNGFCSDTFDFTNIVTILPAPKPGFTVSSMNWCGVPATIALKSNTTTNVVRYFFNMGNEDTISSINPLVNYTYTKPGRYLIKQQVLGITGCITEDSVWIEVKNGLSKSDTVQVLYTTVISNSSTKTVWKAIPYAVRYSVNTTKSTTDTFYIDPAAQPGISSEAYIISAYDSCGNRTAESHTAKTIFLKAKNVNYNEFALLEYTPYETWKLGVMEYRIEYYNKNLNEWELLTSNPSTKFTYNADVVPSNSEILNNTPEICYRITAFEKDGNLQMTSSNIACVDIYPVVFIPTAFSPNNDGVNDFFKPVCAGLTIYIFEIYDRWGQLLYSDTPESKGWDGTFHGKPLPPDVYIYRLSANSYLKSSITNDARSIEKRGSLMLLH